MLWTHIDIDKRKVNELAHFLNISKVLACLLVERGFTIESVQMFLRPSLSQLSDPFDIKNLDAAVKRIEQAVDESESVVIFGDYDVDGVTSTVQLVSVLRTMEIMPKFFVPRRLEEGYGLSCNAIDRILEGHVPHLFIALDCGTNAHESIAYLRELGADVIIIDHHQTKTCAPGNCIFVNPHVNDLDGEPWHDLSTTGLVFKLLHGLLIRRRQSDDPRAAGTQLKNYLDLVAMGTVADLVPLYGENRILSWFGLRHLRANGRAGVRALAEVSGIESYNDISSSDISFKIAPRINASGRLADASLPIDLLLQDDYSKCLKMAKELDKINKERQIIERNITKVAIDRAETEFADLPGIVLFNQAWHPGVVGIVASRLSRQFHKPCVILGCEGNIAKGSGRSVATVNLVNVFHRCAELLEHWGGHPMAAGVSLKSSNVEKFTQCYIESLIALHPNGLPKPSIKISAWLEITDLEESLLNELDRLHPFGQGNQEPIFGLLGLKLEESPNVFGSGNFRFRLPTLSQAWQSIAGIAWQLGEPPKEGQKIDIAFRFSWNYWRNKRYPQITLVDWRVSKSEI